MTGVGLVVGAWGKVVVGMGEEEKAEAERVAEEREVVERLELGGPAELAGEGAAEVAMAAVVGVAGPTVEHGV